MAFQPYIDQELKLNGTAYRLAGHPMAPHLPYGQEGRMATVYKLGAGRRDYALKVFKQTYRNAAIASLSRRLKPFSSLPGLTVCDRLVLEPAAYPALIRAEPDLAYGIVMPWIEGPTWMDMLTEPEPLTSDQSLSLAVTLCKMLTQLEQESVAHCDLSGANLLFTDLETRPSIALVDVEQLYAGDMDKPSTLLVGTPGYGHLKAGGELWGPRADRFSGAILLAELLSWSSETAREVSWGESFFDPDELHEDGERFFAMTQTLQANWSEDVATLFTQAWRSTTLMDCPSFTDWLAALPDNGGVEVTTMASETAVVSPKQETEAADAVTIPSAVTPQGIAESSATSSPKPLLSLKAMLAKAEQYEAAGRLDDALQFYEQAQSLLAEGRDEDVPLTAKEIDDKINALALKQITQSLAQVGSMPPAHNMEVAADHSADAIPVVPVVKPYTPAATLTKKLGGLTQTQFILVLIALPVAAILVMYLAAHYLQGSWIWTTVSPLAILGSALYVALRRRWVTMALYSPIIFFGSTVVSASWIPTTSLIAIAVIAGLILESVTWLSTYFVSDPVREWRKDLVWITIASFAAAAFVEEIVLVRFEYIVRVEYWLVNLLLAAAGWFIGDYLRQFIIHLREMRKGAASNG